MLENNKFCKNKHKSSSQDWMAILVVSWQIECQRWRENEVMDDSQMSGYKTWKDEVPSN
jgi:hypothetical protein